MSDASTSNQPESGPADSSVDTRVNQAPAGASAREPDLLDTLRFDTPIAEPAQPTSPRPLKPRIRSGAIVWGLIVSAAAVFLLAIVTSPANAAAFSAWTGSLGWGGAILVAVIAVGAFILIMALLSVIRSAQRRRSTP